MSIQDSCDLDTEHPFILPVIDFERYIEVKDGHIIFERLSDEPTKIAVLASLFNIISGKYEPFNCVLSYSQYIEFISQLNISSGTYEVKTKLRCITGEEL